MSKEMSKKENDFYNEKEFNVFELKNPETFEELMMQIKLINSEIYRWMEKLYKINRFANLDMELINESNTKDAIHNISQNVIKLLELIQKKLKE